MLEFKVDKKNRLRCKDCGSLFVYVRLKENQCVCRSCGKVNPLEEKPEENKEDANSSRH